MKNSMKVALNEKSLNFNQSPGGYVAYPNSNGLENGKPIAGLGLAG
jgi:hypothetical protein